MPRILCRWGLLEVWHPMTSQNAAFPPLWCFEQTVYPWTLQNSSGCFCLLSHLFYKSSLVLFLRFIHGLHHVANPLYFLLWSLYGIFGWWYAYLLKCSSLGWLTFPLAWKGSYDHPPLLSLVYIQANLTSAFLKYWIGQSLSFCSLRVACFTWIKSSFDCMLCQLSNYFWSLEKEGAALHMFII